MQCRLVALGGGLTACLLGGLLALSGAVFSPVAAGPKAVELTRYVWSDLPEGMGGLSGIELSDDGTRFAVISDAGWITTGLVRRKQGQITTWRAKPFVPLRAPSGLTQGSARLDAEGLALRADGTLAISYEVIPRVFTYDTVLSPRAHALPDNPHLPRFTGNRGLEALAEDPQGCLVAILEQAEGGGYPVYRLCQKGRTPGRWDLVARLAKAGRFVPVGADYGPDGWLYLLERHFTGVGFRSRIRRLDLSRPDMGAQTLMTSAVWAYDNLEGLSVWADRHGNLRLTAVSDDNFLSVQVTQIVEFAVQD